jgi:predicted adenylyl cyclase CyaB
MKEVEVKILEVNRSKIEETLLGLGAEKVFDGDIKTLFFDFNDGAIIKAKNVLRLRKEPDKTELAFKKVHATHTAKEAEEYSVEVSSLETTKKILENLGLSVIECMDKHRVSYMLNHARFDVDRYLGDYSYIPEFLEIEAENTDLIYKYAELLGFKAKDCFPWSTNELIKHYASKAKKKP